MINFVPFVEATVLPGRTVGDVTSAVEAVVRSLPPDLLADAADVIYARPQAAAKLGVLAAHVLDRTGIAAAWHPPTGPDFEAAFGDWVRSLRYGDPVDEDGLQVLVVDGGPSAVRVAYALPSGVDLEAALAGIADVRLDHGGDAPSP